MTATDVPEACDACKETGKDLTQRTDWPGVPVRPGDRSVLRAPWICDDCIPPGDEGTTT